jgi:small subunit ribosomal protein S8
MLTRIRNASRARLDRVDVPQSNLKERLAALLKSEGYIDDFRVIAGHPQGVIEIKLRYGAEREPVINGIRRLSTPGLRRYMDHDEIPKVKNGQGIVILTTSKGLMSDRRARKEGLGGEAICSLW